MKWTSILAIYALFWVMCAFLLLPFGVKTHDEAGVAASCAVLEAAGLRPQVMVDVSHGNSGKQAERQIEIAAALGERIAAGETRIFGLMIESHLEAGRQDLRPGVPLRRGVSITDACIGWEETLPLLRGLAGAVRARRRA